MRLCAIRYVLVSQKQLNELSLHWTVNNALGRELLKEHTTRLRGQKKGVQLEGSCISQALSLPLSLSLFPSPLHLRTLTLHEYKVKSGQYYVTSL